MAGLTVGQLEVVKRDTLNLIPDYNVAHSDPHKALESGSGTCAAKAAIAAGIIVMRHHIEPAVAFSRRFHGSNDPEIDKPKDPRTGRSLAHIFTLVPESGGSTFDILGLDFNGATQNAYDGEVMAYNTGLSQYASCDDSGDMRATPEASELQITVLPWRDGMHEYLGKIDIAFDANVLLTHLGFLGITE